MQLEETCRKRSIKKMPRIRSINKLPRIEGKSLPIFLRNKSSNGSDRLVWQLSIVMITRSSTEISHAEMSF
jgi:hypothetical protein